ncbi:hypothetical protein E8E14_009923 [Neopestalotiopsis sp. 37M]|nr:hypothetical protein E8E14_009923 [Neopestalotiopsis sp. 37M]
MDGDPAIVDAGVSRVSGYYGPGAVGAWWLLSLAALISLSTRDRIAPGATESPSFWNLFNIDTDVIAAVGYPAVASFDLLYNLKTYTSDPHSAALYCAPLLILLEAELVIVALLCAVAMRVNRTGLRTIDFVSIPLLLFLIYFYLSRQAAEWVCMDEVPLLRGYSLVPITPLVLTDGARRLSQCQQSTDDYIKSVDSNNPDRGGDSRPGVSHVDNHEEFSILAFGLILPGAVITLIVGHERLFLGSNCTRPEYWYNVIVFLLAASLGWFGWFVFGFIILPLMYDIILLFQLVIWKIVFGVLRVEFGGAMIPKSAASLLDLDQMAAFIVGGLVPLVMRTAPVLRRLLATLRHRLRRDNLANNGDAL